MDEFKHLNRDIQTLIALNLSNMEIFKLCKKDNFSFCNHDYFWKELFLREFEKRKNNRKRSGTYFYDIFGSSDVTDNQISMWIQQIEPKNYKRYFNQGFLKNLSLDGLAELGEYGAILDKMSWYEFINRFIFENRVIDDMISFIKKHKDLINKKDINGDILLFLEAYNKHKPFVEWLLENGADINLENRLGETFLWKILGFDKNMLDIALKYGANVNHMYRGQTPLGYVLNVKNLIPDRDYKYEKLKAYGAK